MRELDYSLPRTEFPLARTPTPPGASRDFPVTDGPCGQVTMIERSQLPLMSSSEPGVVLSSLATQCVPVWCDSCVKTSSMPARTSPDAIASPIRTGHSSGADDERAGG